MKTLAFESEVLSTQYRHLRCLASEIWIPLLGGGNKMSNKCVLRGGVYTYIYIYKHMCILCTYIVHIRKQVRFFGNVKHFCEIFHGVDYESFEFFI